MAKIKFKDIDSSVDSVVEGLNSDQIEAKALTSIDEGNETHLSQKRVLAQSVCLIFARYGLIVAATGGTVLASGILDFDYDPMPNTNPTNLDPCSNQEKLAAYLLDPDRGNKYNSRKYFICHELIKDLLPEKMKDPHAIDHNDRLALMAAVTDKVVAALAESAWGMDSSKPIAPVDEGVLAKLKDAAIKLLFPESSRGFLGMFRRGESSEVRKNDFATEVREIVRPEQTEYKG